MELSRRDFLRIGLTAAAAFALDGVTFTSSLVAESSRKNSDGKLEHKISKAAERWGSKGLYERGELKEGYGEVAERYSIYFPIVSAINLHNPLEFGWATLLYDDIKVDPDFGLESKVIDIVKFKVKRDKFYNIIIENEEGNYEQSELIEYKFKNPENSTDERVIRFLYTSGPFEKETNKDMRPLIIKNKVEIMRRYLGFALSEAYRDGFDGVHVFPELWNEIKTVIAVNGESFYITSEVSGMSVKFFYKRIDLKNSIEEVSVTQV